MDDAERKSAQLAELVKEEKHYKQLATVFGSPDGLDVLEWLLTELCGYWRSGLDTERTIGKYELGRTLFNHISISNLDICSALLDRRRSAAEVERINERRRIEGRA